DVLEKRNYRIGRLTSAMQKTRPGYLVYDEQTVSAEHAELVWHERERSFLLRHISHTNYTVINGVKLVHGQARGLKAGDQIVMGHLRLVLEKSQARAASPEKPLPQARGVDQTNPWELTKQQFRELSPKHRPPRVSTEDLAVFTRQFSAMLDAGIPIARALTFFGEGLSGGDLCTVVEGMSYKVNSGTRLSHAMRSYPRIFSEVYISLIETGEESGQLSTTLHRLADLMEKQLKMHKRVVAALTYPVILLLVSLACICVFIFVILPQIEPMFLGMNIALPLPTRILLASRNLMLPALTLLVLGGLLSWIFRPFISAFLARKPDLRKKLHRAPLFWPVFGPVMRKIAVARILYSLYSMLDSGMTLVAAITRSANVTGNFWITEQMQVSKAAIVDGETVAAAFEASEVFPAACTQLITIGEETSSLATIVKYVADMYDEDADMALTDMTNMLEPLLMGGMGLIVGFIVISAMLPTLELINHL
ncbi:MAG: type II secretion system F family protein, partial [Candidatus Eremiobacteraeota bacterium]|nr:type II secretion system F family protein [Candidatus Eremiobacteraeota bacterium]